MSNGKRVKNGVFDLVVLVVLMFYAVAGVTLALTCSFYRPFFEFITCVFHKFPLLKLLDTTRWILLSPVIV